jgi:hypothetical protein
MAQVERGPSVSITTPAEGDVTPVQARPARPPAQPAASQISNQVIAERSTLRVPLGPFAQQDQAIHIAQGPHGARIDNGYFNWTAPADSGPRNYKVTIVSGEGPRRAEKKFVITVVDPQGAPRLPQPVDRTIDPTAAIGFSLAAKTPSRTPKKLTYSIQKGPANARIDEAGWFSWTPRKGDAGRAFAVSVTVTGSKASKAPPKKRKDRALAASADGGQISDRSEFFLAVNQVELPPLVPHLRDITVVEGSKLALDLHGWDPNQPPESLSYSLVSPTGATINDQTGAFAWDLQETTPQDYSLAAQIRNAGQQSEIDAKITVVAVTNGPDFPEIPQQTIPELGGIGFSVAPINQDLQIESYRVSEGIGEVDQLGWFSWTSEEQIDDVVMQQFSVIATDSDGVDHRLTPFVINVFKVKTPPLWSPIGEISHAELDPIQLELSQHVVDPDADPASLTYGLVSIAPTDPTSNDVPTGAAVDSSSGRFTWTPSEGDGPGQFKVTVSVSDGTDDVPTSFLIDVSEVNQAPYWDPIPDQPIVEGSQLQIDLKQYAHDPDLPQQTLLFSLVDGPGALTSDGIYTWDDPQPPGTYQVDVSVSDGQVATATWFDVIVEAERFLVHITGVADHLSVQQPHPPQPQVKWQVFLADFSGGNLTPLTSSPQATSVDIATTTYADDWTFTKNDVPGNRDLVLRVWAEDSQGTMEAEACRCIRIIYP